MARSSIAHFDTAQRVRILVSGAGSRCEARIRHLVARLVEVPFSAPIISGETGTGKGLVARILHHSGSRADGPLIAEPCDFPPAALYLDRRGPEGVEQLFQVYDRREDPSG